MLTAKWIVCLGPKKAYRIWNVCRGLWLITVRCFVHPDHVDSDETLKPPMTGCIYPTVVPTTVCYKLWPGSLSESLNSTLKWWVSLKMVGLLLIEWLLDDLGGPPSWETPLNVPSLSLPFKTKVCWTLDQPHWRILFRKEPDATGALVVLGPWMGNKKNLERQWIHNMYSLYSIV